MSEPVSANEEQTHIVNGKTVPAGKYPWMVALLLSYGGKAIDDFVCGGTLIDRQWVLTAAHCVDRRPPEFITVSVNAVDLREDDEIDRIPVTDVLIHSSFVNFGYRDIALLKLQRKVARNVPTLKVIDSATQLSVGTTATVMGWGKTKSYDFYAGVSPRLKETQLEIGHRQICDNYSTPFFPAHEICIASPTRDSIECSGDSGGPAIVKDDATDEYYQIGVVSWGSSPCDTHYGSVHTNLAGLSKWISRQIADRAVDYETVDSVRPIDYYCVGLTCVFDASSQLYYATRILWTTDDGGRSTGSAVFRHEFSAAGDYEVRLVSNSRYTGRAVDTLKVKVKRGVATPDRQRFSLYSDRFLSGDADDFTKVLSNAGQGTWFYDGPATFRLRNFRDTDYDLELWRYDFDSSEWQLLAFSATPGRAPERISRNLKSGFYYLNVVTNGQPGDVRIYTVGQISRRTVCSWFGQLYCRPGRRI